MFLRLTLPPLSPVTFSSIEPVRELSAIALDSCKNQLSGFGVVLMVVGEISGSGFLLGAGVRNELRRVRLLGDVLGLKT